MLRLFATGSNSDGQLGIGCAKDVAKWMPCVKEGHEAFPPVGMRVLRIVSTSTCAAAMCEVGDVRTVWVSGRAWDMSTTHFREVSLPQAANVVVDLAACWDCVYVVCRGEVDEVWALGASNVYGQWGAGPDARSSGTWHQVRLTDAVASPRVLSIAGGVRHCIAAVACESGTQHAIIGWGHARHGQLGDVPGHVKVRYIPKVIHAWPQGERTFSLAPGMHHTVIGVHEQGMTRFMAYGSNKHGQLEALEPVQGYVTPTSNWNTVLLCGDRVSAHGANHHGQALGDGLATRGGHISSGSEHNVLLSDGEAIGWGWNEHGNLACLEAESVAPRRMNMHFACRVWTGYGTTWTVMRQG